MSRTLLLNHPARTLKFYIGIFNNMTSTATGELTVYAKHIDIISLWKRFWACVWLSYVIANVLLHVAVRTLVLTAWSQEKIYNIYICIYIYTYIHTGLFKMIVGVLTTCHTQYTSFSRCNPMWFLSVWLRQGSGLCSSSSRKYPWTEGSYMLQTVGTNSIIVLTFVESQTVHI